MKEEIAAEALTRNLAAFTRFLDVVGIMNGEVVNYAKIASDVGVDAKTVKAYFEILEDTLMGRFVAPLPSKPGSRKHLVATPKFYLFDTGVAGALRQTWISSLAGGTAGHLMETFIANELAAFHSYWGRRRSMYFYRTNAGSEIDFVLNYGEVAIEVKLSDLYPRRGFESDEWFPGRISRSKGLCGCLENRSRIVIDGSKRIEILPWQVFCAKLWRGEICTTVPVSSGLSDHL